MRSIAPALALLLLWHPVAAFAHPSASARLEILTQRIAARPGDQRLYIARGAVHSHDAQYELALADLRKAEELGDPAVVAYELGVLHYRMGKPDAARTYLDTFLARFPHHPPALEQRARVLHDAGEYEAALSDYRAFFANQEHPSPGHYVSAARLLSEMKDEGASPAIAMLEQGMERLGLIPQLQHFAIELELKRGNTAGAIVRLESLEPMLGESPEWKVGLGELLLLDGRNAEARERFDEAAEQLSELRSTPARRALGRKLQELSAGAGDQRVANGCGGS